MQGSGFNAEVARQMEREDGDQRDEAGAPERAGATRARGGDEVAPATGAEPSAEAAASVPRDAAELRASVELLLQQTRWADIVQTLGPQERAAELPPTLALIYAMALAETAGAGSTTKANLLAIRSVASLLSVPEDSGTALMVAKRVMRRNPVAWRARPAPRAPLRIALVVVALALGIVAGWLSGPKGIGLQEIVDVVVR